jgi:hypothetical protein
MSNDVYSSYRPIYPRQEVRSLKPLIVATGLALLSGLILLIIIGGLVFTFLINTLRTDEVFVPPAAEYSVIGKPSITASFINQVLDYYDSPASGKGQTLYDYGVKYGVDPAYALAFFMHESSFGKQGVAKVTRSLGNIRATEGYDSYQGYRKYKTWEEGFEDWYRLIAKTYVQQWKLYTIDQIIPVYAPREDNNDEGAYIRSVKLAVSKWQRGIVEV